MWDVIWVPPPSRTGVCSSWVLLLRLILIFVAGIFVTSLKERFRTCNVLYLPYLGCPGIEVSWNRGSDYLRISIIAGNRFLLIQLEVLLNVFVTERAQMLSRNVVRTPANFCGRGLLIFSSCRASLSCVDCSCISISQRLCVRVICSCAFFSQIFLTSSRLSPEAWLYFCCDET